MYQSVIIIGAGRSGTNILRDTLTCIPGFGTWPCDEINYIWRHGNARYPTDEFPEIFATDGVKRFIRRTFDRLASSQEIDFIVEKTCANSLRVQFVNAVFPSARFLFLIRDGRDVITSAMERWKSYLKGMGHNLKKARFVPVADVPYYLTRYLRNVAFRAFSQKRQLAFWGPRFEGMIDMLSHHTLSEVCAMQWVRCVERAEQDFLRISSERIYRIRYEDFVNDSTVEISKICRFLGVELAAEFAASVTRRVSSKSIGRWRKQLSSEDLDLIMPIIKRVQARYGYNAVNG